MYAGLSVGVCPGNFAASINLCAIWKTELHLNGGRRTQRLRCQKIESVLAQIQQDAFSLRIIFNFELHRNLYRNSKRRTAFAFQEYDRSPQTRFRLGSRKRLVEYEICPFAEHIPKCGFVAQQ